MEAHSSNLTAWCEKLSLYHIPRWNELPQIDLYMDQVVLLIEQFLHLYLPGEDKFITPAMINNYVKSKVIPPPIKKRYSRMHIAYLVFICMLKQVLSISDIHSLLIANTNADALPKVYDTFCEAQEKAYAFIVQAGLETPRLFTGNAIELTNGESLNMSLLAGASKTMAQQLLHSSKVTKKD